MKKILLSSFLGISSFCSAQLGNWAPTGMPGVTQEIRCMYTDTVNNYLYVGGGILHHQWTFDSSMICRYNGSVWDTLGYFNDKVLSIITYNDTLVATGFFTSINGVPISYIAKFDGSNWLPFGNFSYPLWNLRIIDDTLYAMGVITQVDGLPLNGVAKWTGTNWTSFFNCPYTDAVLDLVKFNNEFYIVGGFSTPFACAVYRSGSWQQVGQGFVGTFTGIEKMIVYKNELYVFGIIDKPEGNVGHGTQKWNGTTWSEVGTGLQDLNNSYNSFCLTHDVKIHNDELYVCGVFYYAGNIPAKGIAKWDGLKWCGLGSQVFDMNIQTALEFYNDTLFVAVNDDTLSGVYINGLLKFTGNNFSDTCSSPLEIAEIQYPDNVISVYPNPTTGKLTISSSEEIEIIEIYNLFGEIVFYSTISLCKIDLSKQPAGMYFIQIQEDKKVHTGKFIKL